MEKKENFKKFIMNYPEAIDMVRNNKTTWQKLYELYDIYGEDNSIWTEYLNSKETINIKNILNTIKKINIDSLEENISSIQKVVGLLSDLSTETKEESVKPNYENVDKIYGEENESK